MHLLRDLFMTKDMVDTNNASANVIHETVLVKFDIIINFVDLILIFIETVGPVEVGAPIIIGTYVIGLFVIGILL